MAIELARVMMHSRPWGASDLRPWSNLPTDDALIGEISFERSSDAAHLPALLVKLLFTTSPLSIQVHPDDVGAQSMGLPNGKTESWYILDALQGASVGIGLAKQTSDRELREAAGDGTLSNLLVWKQVAKGDVVHVPGGTIHSIGAGLVVAEVQQRSDITFRLFDHGRPRELHVESALKVANMGPQEIQPLAQRLTDERLVLVSDPHFMFERIDFKPGSDWSVGAEVETWLLVIEGAGKAGTFDVVKGDAVFAQADRVDVVVGNSGLSCLVAYASAVASPDLLRSPSGTSESRTRPTKRTPTHQIVARPAQKMLGDVRVSTR